jgi:hypothetical protein
METLPGFLHENAAGPMRAHRTGHTERTLRNVRGRENILSAVHEAGVKKM